MKEGKGREKKYEAPMHLIEISEPTHAVRVTKNRQTTRYIAKKSTCISEQRCLSFIVLLSDTTKDSKTVIRTNEVIILLFRSQSARRLPCLFATRDSHDNQGTIAFNSLDCNNESLY